MVTYISPAKYAEKHGVSRQYVMILIAAKRIPEARTVEFRGQKYWEIPENLPFPKRNSVGRKPIGDKPLRDRKKAVKKKSRPKLAK